MPLGIVDLPIFTSLLLKLYTVLLPEKKTYQRPRKSIAPCPFSRHKQALSIFRSGIRTSHLTWSCLRSELNIYIRIFIFYTLLRPLLFTKQSLRLYIFFSSPDDFGHLFSDHNDWWEITWQFPPTRFKNPITRLYSVEDVSLTQSLFTSGYTNVRLYTT